LTHDALAEMMTLCKTKAGLSQTAEVAGHPTRLSKTSVWLQYLEALGLNGCLADDMDWESRRK